MLVLFMENSTSSEDPKLRFYDSSYESFCNVSRAKSTVTDFIHNKKSYNDEINFFDEMSSSSHHVLRKSVAKQIHLSFPN